MNDTEREVIILNSAWEMIDEMVNWAMFVKNECTEPTQERMHGTYASAVNKSRFLSAIHHFSGRFSFRNQVVQRDRSARPK